MKRLPLAVMVGSLTLLTGCQTLERIDADIQQWHEEWTSSDVEEPGPAVAEAEASTSQVHYLLGLRLLDGNDGVASQAAVDAFRKAAEQGHAEAQNLLGMALLSGQGVAQDMDQARHWLQAAAQQGQADAQYQLGKLYLNARGVPAEEAWGVHWIACAAAAGHAQAQFESGVAWATGLGLPKNLDEARFWMTLAANQEVEQAAAVLAKLNAGQSATALAELQSRVRNWQASPQAMAWPRPRVRFVQHGLNRLGHAAGAVDGWMGPQTAEAISEYRQATGLSGGKQLDKQLVHSLRHMLRGE